MAGIQVEVEATSGGSIACNELCLSLAPIAASAAGKSAPTGPLGLLSVLSAKHMRAERIIAISRAASGQPLPALPGKQLNIAGGVCGESCLS